MDDWRIIEELDRMREWDVDALCDALNITSTDILIQRQFLEKAVEWIEENFE